MEPKHKIFGMKVAWWFTEFHRMMDKVEAFLQWAFSHGGDTAMKFRALISLTTTEADIPLKRGTSASVIRLSIGMDL